MFYTPVVYLIYIHIYQVNHKEINVLGQGTEMLPSMTIDKAATTLAHLTFCVRDNPKAVSQDQDGVVTCLHHQ